VEKSGRTLDLLCSGDLGNIATFCLLESDYSPVVN
jgi:hypothetical protein